MKVIKNTIIGLGIILLSIVIGIIALYIICPIYNDVVAKRLTGDLESISLPEKTIYVDDFCAAGKLCGNGNGMQYFGAILVKSDLSLDELSEYYKKYDNAKCKKEVQKQESSEITQIEHMVGGASFDAEVTEDNYYIVYSWGNYNGFASEFDLRGH